MSIPDVRPKEFSLGVLDVWWKLHEQHGLVSVLPKVGDIQVQLYPVLTANQVAGR